MDWVCFCFCSWSRVCCSCGLRPSCSQACSKLMSGMWHIGMPMPGGLVGLGLLLFLQLVEGLLLLRAEAKLLAGLL